MARSQVQRRTMARRWQTPEAYAWAVLAQALGRESGLPPRAAQLALDVDWFFRVPSACLVSRDLALVAHASATRPASSGSGRSQAGAHVEELQRIGIGRGDRRCSRSRQNKRAPTIGQKSIPHQKLPQRLPLPQQVTRAGKRACLALVKERRIRAGKQHGCWLGGSLTPGP